MSDLIDEVIKVAGTILVASDAQDVGKFDRIHHWQIGAVLLTVPVIRKLIEEYL